MRVVQSNQRHNLDAGILLCLFGTENVYTTTSLWRHIEGPRLMAVPNGNQRVLTEAIRRRVTELQ